MVSESRRDVPFISITRLRIRSLRYLPGFAVHTLRSQKQVRHAPGFREGAVLADHDWAFWTMTAWDDEAAMRCYMTNGAHRQAMPRLIHWCDEASVVHWTESEAGLPSWAEADRRMRLEGRPSKVRHPSTEQGALDYRSPRLTRSGPIKPAGA